MRLREFLNVMNGGCTCFTIRPYCEEYGAGLDALKQEPWYRDIKELNVRRVTIIGGGYCKVETCVEIDGGGGA